LDENRSKNGARTEHILPAFADQAKYLPPGTRLTSLAFVVPAKISGLVCADQPVRKS